MKIDPSVCLSSKSSSFWNVPRGGGGGDEDGSSALVVVATAPKKRRRRFFFGLLGPYIPPTYQEVLEEQVLLLEQQLRQTQDRVTQLRDRYQQLKMETIHKGRHHHHFPLSPTAAKPMIIDDLTAPLKEEIVSLQDLIHNLESERDNLLELLEQSRIQMNTLEQKWIQTQNDIRKIQDDYERRLQLLESNLESSQRDALQAVEKERRKMRKLVKALAIREKKLLARAENKKKNKNKKNNNSYTSPSSTSTSSWTTSSSSSSLGKTTSPPTVRGPRK